MPDTLHIVVPVFNEAENFPALWEQIKSCVHSEFKVLVIYDFDQDNTVPVVQRLIAAGDTGLQTVRNDVGPGVVGAILTGFQQVQSGPVLVVMADLSDDLPQVDKMLDLYHQGSAIVVGSRYMKGGKIIGGPWLKQTLSRLAGISLYWLRGIPTHDATNAFKIYDREMLRRLQLQSKQGFELNLEITAKAFLAGYRITEIPATWRDRSAGQSRFRMWKWLPKYLRWYVHAFQPKRRGHAITDTGVV